MPQSSSRTRPLPLPQLLRLALAALVLSGSYACGNGTIERDEASSGGPGGPTGGGTIAPSQAPLPGPGEAPEGSPVALHGQLRIEGGRMVDASGAPVQLEGVSSMWLNWEKGYSQYQAATTWMRDNWSVQLIRAAMGVEPQGAYLSNPKLAEQQVETVIENAIISGIYVLVDWHDHTAQDHQAQASEFFTSMAEKWGAYPNVIWETYNEPTPPNGTWANIKPYHEAVLAAIRSKDPDNIVVLGTPNWSQRPDEAAADPVAGENLMYTLHFYACDHTANIRGFGQAALDAGQAVFVTEWGATTADGGLPESGARLCLDEAQAWHDWMDAEGVSWAAWKLDACEDASCFFTAAASLSGDWTATDLQGHGPFVVERLLD